MTMVAIWIKKDTSVRSAIAYGYHICKPTWADFATAAIINKIQIDLV